MVVAMRSHDRARADVRRRIGAGGDLRPNARTTPRRPAYNHVVWQDVLGKTVRAIVHSTTDIENLLRRGLTPITDNRTALLELGFQRAYPQIVRRYEATIWERAIDAATRARDGDRMLVCQRALLETRVDAA